MFGGGQECWGCVGNDGLLENWKIGSMGYWDDGEMGYWVVGEMENWIIGKMGVTERFNCPGGC